jgi:hypothetical protein
MGAFSNIKGLTYYGNAEDDPYVTLEAVRSSTPPALATFPPLLSFPSLPSSLSRSHFIGKRRRAMIIDQYTQIAERSGFSRLNAMRSTF